MTPEQEARAERAERELADWKTLAASRAEEHSETLHLLAEERAKREAAECIVARLDKCLNVSELVMSIHAAESRAEAAERELAEERASPVLVILFCPLCRKQHIDEGEWAERPHRVHRCVDDACGKGCGNEWRASLVPTCGVTYAELEAP